MDIGGRYNQNWKRERPIAPSEDSWVFRTAETCTSTPLILLRGFNFKPQLLCSGVVIAQPPAEYSICVTVLRPRCVLSVCVWLRVACAHSHEWSFSLSCSRQNGLFEECPSHMLTQFCTPSSLGSPYASFDVPPSLSIFSLIRDI